MKKNNMKCVRLTDETLDYINNFHGEGFNQKFENIVELMSKREVEIKRKIGGLLKRREMIESEIEELCKVKNKMEAIARCIEQAHDLVSY